MRRTIWMRSLVGMLLSWPSLMSGLALGQVPSTSPSTSSASAASPARRPEVWSIVVGVGNYEDPRILDSRTAARNAGEVLQWIRQAGWDRSHQLFLLDFGNADPGQPEDPRPNIRPLKRNLDWAFQRWLFTRAQPGDLVVFYFAGQSRALVKTENPRVDPRIDHYLLPTDAVPDHPERNGWSLDQAIDACARRRLQVVCWLATSVQEDRQGSVPQAAVPPPLPPPAGAAASPAVPPFIRPNASLSTGVSWLSRLARWPAVSAWLAADRARTPGPAADPGDAFTKALLMALGKPDPQRKVKPNLAACLKELQQHPQLKLQGFSSVGGVPPWLTLWASEFGKPITVPKPEVVLQVGHADKLTALTPTADGRFIVTASMDSTVRIWSAPDRSLLRVLPDQAVGATALAMSRDERWLISGGGRGAVFVYDRQHDFAPLPLAGGQPHNRRITQISLLPDGVHFVSVDREGRSYLWDTGESPLAPKPWLSDTDCQELAGGGRFDPDGDDTGVVLARCGDGRVRSFDSAGRGGAILDFPPGRPKALAVSHDGRLIAVGFADGTVIVRDLRARRQVEHRATARPVAVRRLAFSPEGKLAIGHEAGARLVSRALPPAGGDAEAERAPAARAFDLIADPLQCLDFSPSGEYLAACTENVGALRVWRIDAEGPPQVILDDRAAKAFLLGFTGNNRGLVLGDFDGAFGFRPLDPQGDEVPWTFPAHRGKIQQLSPTPSRRFLLFLDEQRQARIWDLRDRTCRRLQGTWSAGAFLDDDRLVLIPDSNSTNLAGRLILVDRDRLGTNPTFFARQAGASQLPDAVDFERMALAPDGTRLAAASDASKEPMVAVWDARTGRLTHWITAARLEDPVIALSFSSDGRYLLTGGDAPTARLWDLAAAPGEIAAPAVTFSDPAVRNNIACAAIRPGHADQVVTGHSNGQVHLWSWSGGKARMEVRQLVAGTFAGTVKSLSFTTDGQHLAAAGDGTRIWVGEMEPRPRSINILNALRPHHYEQINALAAWQGLPMLISGSDDTTVRFWDLKKGTLWGTFSAASRPAVGEAAAVQELDWVLVTPEGRYDAPPSATRLARFRSHDRPLMIESLEKTHNVFRLSEQLLLGEDPRLERQLEEPPPVSISVPPRADPTTPQTRLTISLGARDLKDVRLYHNDVLVPCGWERYHDQPPEDLSFEVVVRLAPQRNRFYALASRDGAFDTCSKVVEVDYTGPSEPGRLHILALGVGGYDRRRLHFARRDAERLSQVLHARGLDASGQPGFVDVLRDDEVNRESVKRAFDRIADRVQDRPQDTVVVFLAGHTGVFARQSFCLLLPSYPFAEEEPIQVAARDAADTEADVDPQFVLPYSVIALNFMRLKALNRLVIVDACQAEAIQQDPQVRSIQKWMDISSRQVRTSYLMAARRGEPALEVEPLGHGLFTYALLRGMGAIPLAGEPREVAALGLPRDADFNKDGVLSTSELDAYAKQVLPRISEVFPQLVASRRDALVARNATSPATTTPASTAATARPPRLDQAPRLQGAEVSFPLVPLTQGQSGAGVVGSR